MQLMHAARHGSAVLHLSTLVMSLPPVAGVAAARARSGRIQASRLNPAMIGARIHPPGNERREPIRWAVACRILEGVNNSASDDVSRIRHRRPPRCWAAPRQSRHPCRELLANGRRAGTHTGGLYPPEVEATRPAERDVERDSSRAASVESLTPQADPSRAPDDDASRQRP